MVKSVERVVEKSVDRVVEKSVERVVERSVESCGELVSFIMSTTGLFPENLVRPVD